nr:hypothetical protein PEB16_04345 [Staphylococcus aureus]
MNKKLLTKTLIASALVLTTVGSGFHSSSNYNGINNKQQFEGHINPLTEYHPQSQYD